MNDEAIEKVKLKLSYFIDQCLLFLTYIYIFVIEYAWKTRFFRFQSKHKNY